MRGIATIVIAAALWCSVPTPVSAGESSPDPIAAEQVDRELLVRFSRAYGMARSAVEQRDDAPDEADLIDVDALDDSLQRELYEIMDLNGVSRDEWRGMLARMEQDRALRERVESLSMPFQVE